MSKVLCELLDAPFLSKKELSLLLKNPWFRIMLIISNAAPEGVRWEGLEDLDYEKLQNSGYIKELIKMYQENTKINLSEVLRTDPLFALANLFILESERNHRVTLKFSLINFSLFVANSIFLITSFFNDAPKILILLSFVCFLISPKASILDGLIKPYFTWDSDFHIIVFLLKRKISSLFVFKKFSKLHEN